MTKLIYIYTCLKTKNGVILKCKRSASLQIKEISLKGSVSGVIPFHVVKVNSEVLSLEEICPD